MNDSGFRIKYQFNGTNREVCNVMDAIIKSDITDYGITMYAFMDGLNRVMCFSTNSVEDLEKVSLFTSTVAKNEDYGIGYGKKSA